MNRVLMIGLVGLSGLALAATPELKVHPEGRYLMTGKGEPFFWLGDTAWELFHRLDREEAVRYLDNRAQLGYTVVQAVAIAELDGVNVPNAYGHKPFGFAKGAKDPEPIVAEGPDNDYWDHVDFIVKAEKVRLAWYDPRTGTENLIGVVANSGKTSFTPPTPGELLDWVLVADAVR